MTEQKINQVYIETSTVLKSIYRKRKAAAFFQKIMWLLLGVYFMGIVLFLATTYFPDKFHFISDYLSTIQNSTTSTYYIIPLFVLVVLSTYLFSYFFSKFKTLEMVTMAKMVKQLFPQFEFTQISKLPISKIKESKLFAWTKQNIPVYTFGQMKTELDGVKLHVSDIGVVEENLSNKTVNFLLKIPFLNLLVVVYHYTLKNIFTSKAADNVYFSYRGMYCWADFNKKLTTSTILLPNTLSSQIDRFASFNFKEEEKILLEDTRFNKYFTVYSPDQIESRYILSSSVMEKIVDIREQFGSEIMLSFLNNKVFIAIENPNGIFSFPSGKLDSVMVIKELVTKINTTQNILNDLKLNRKAFTSQK